MKTHKAESVLTKITLQCGDELSRLTFDSMFAIETFRRARNDLEEQIRISKQRQRATDQEQRTTPSRSMWSRLIATDLRFYPPKVVTMNPHGARDEEFLTVLEDALMAQCNWFFVTAFEAYERFLKSTYAALGYLDNRFWSCSDYGDIPAADIQRLKQSWYIDHVKKRPARFQMDTILKNLRRMLPQLRKHEDGQLNARMWICVAAHFRHIIVHNRGRTAKEGFWKKLEEVTGYSFIAKTMDTALRGHAVSRHLRSDTEDYLITMIDRSQLQKDHGNFDSLLRSMIDHVASHALLIYSTLGHHFGFVPYWEKQKEPQSP